jgi:hypothetical protein
MTQRNTDPPDPTSPGPAVAAGREMPSQAGGEPGPVILAREPLPGFTTGLFVQAWCSEATAVTDLVRSAKVGIVYTLRHRERHRQFPGGAVTHTRNHAVTPNLLVDANCYSGKNRRPASHPPDRSWITFQHDTLHLPWAMTDSGYCGAGEYRELKTLFTAAAGMGDRVITALPIARQWLSDDADTVRALINDQPNPVALMVEDDEDPFDASGVVDGLVHLLRADRPVLLLRCDTAALGALAHGAALGAVGTHSGLRHIYPLRDGGGGPENLSFVIPALLGYYLTSRFTRAYAADPSLPTWTCACSYCAGHRDLSWIAADTDPTSVAFQHSVAAIADLGTQLIGLSMSMTPARAWSQMCGLAQAEHDQVSNPSGTPWRPKKALRHWLGVTPTTVGR